MSALRRALATAAATALAAALTPVASAQAPPRQPALVRFVAPTPGQAVNVSNPTIHAFVSSVPGQKLFVTVAGPATVTREVTATSSCQEVRETVPLSHNGSYVVTVMVDGVPAVPLDQPCQGGTAEPRQFFVAAPPKPPSGVKAALEGRAVNVSWAKNPEPDIVSYRVQLSVGAGAFQQVGEVPGTSFKHGSVPPGSLRYRVLAVRRGAKPGETLVSAPSAAVTVARAGAGGSRGGGGSYSASGSSKPVFSGPPQPGGGAAAAAGEEGFDERLPYTAGEEEEPRELGAEETSNSSHRTLAFIAGGLLVLAVYMHLWWLKRQAEEPLSA